ncbi:unnamed protein product [Vitrella brassicaformis CCMP3155]|uniref:MSP domain-containing protein n=1 Tax=Vitrella brassicaformis (strain CCMP3155) TaxID=1169540 RepID=A0A0G4FR40_VITBC|nr:unnamed protein product [Vitrella brassicaformis CCMP3155]|eukprot:CEM16919.1 unnamed protein product [Vitrella brassicaformis CCMP3155]
MAKREGVNIILTPLLSVTLEKTIEFPVQLDSPVTANLRLENTTNAPVAYKIQTTAPLNYIYMPGYGTLKAQDTQGWLITLKKPMADPPPSTDRFRVMATQGFRVQGFSCLTQGLGSQPLPSGVRMTFTRFVEPGRVCLITYGPDVGKICTIVDVVDDRRALIDGPLTGVVRQTIPYKRLRLTDLRVEVDRGCSTDSLAQALEDDSTLSKWEETTWAKKLAAKKRRANLTDLERFKVMVARKKKSRVIKDAIKKK